MTYETEIELLTQREVELEFDPTIKDTWVSEARDTCV